MRVNERGFTLVELLIVVAIIGILVAIAVPNILDAIDRSKQRATMGDMRAWGNGVGSYYSEKGFFPTPGPIDIVKADLVPYAINALPTTDHWKNEFSYDADLVLDTYTIESFGKDNIDALGVTPTTWQDYNLDIVLADGIFVNAPY